jgi:hypothetical protein
MEIVYNDEILQRASRGYIQGYYAKDQATTDKPSVHTLLRAYREEPTVQAGIKALADEIVKNGYIIKGTDKKLIKRVEKELKTKFRFKRLLRRIVYNSLIYGNSFIELVYKNNSVDELHLLETSEMSIIADQHGEVQAYEQDHKGEKATFTTDECVHLSINNITSGMWGEADIKTLYSTIALKQFLEGFITNLFKFNKFRDAWSIEDADEVQIKNFINDLKLSRDQPDKELVIEGKIAKIAGRDIKDLNQLVELLNYTRQQILTLLRVPPIIAGIPDNSNRSNSEVQSRKAFDGRVISLQDVMEDEFTLELFPKIGWSNAEFEFAPIDKRAEKDDIEIAVALKNLGLDNDSLLQYIKDVGIQLREGATLESTEAGPDPFPQSRKPVDKSAEMDEETGEESTTRQDQLERSQVVLDQYAEEVLKK